MHKEYDALVSVMADHGLHAEYVRMTNNKVSVKLADVPDSTRTAADTLTALRRAVIDALAKRRIQLSQYAQISVARPDVKARFDDQIKRISESLSRLGEDGTAKT